MKTQHHIAIIGGGFSGTMTAVNLARFCEVPLRVTLINHGYPQGRGVAYSTRRPEHLLNVAARNMSALPEHPNHFVEWLRTRTEYAEMPDAELRETFMPRRIYGDYVRSLTLHYMQPIDRRGNVETTVIDDEAVDIATVQRGVRIMLGSGSTLDADKVLLATGNEMPAELPGGETLATSSNYAANPWQDWESKLPPPTEAIVLLGTGLTTIDAIVTLLALDWRGTIHAVSRNGLLPQSHFKGVHHPEFPPADVDVAELGLTRLAALVDEHCRRLREAGENPAIVVDKLRSHTQRVWQAFSLAERREFIARHAAHWNVLRHRIAQPIHQQVARAITEGRLKITRGAVTRLEQAGARIRVHLNGTANSNGNHEHSPAHLDGALVVNCTGPQTRFSATRSRLLRNLLASGIVQPDAIDLGIRIENNFAAVDHEGRPSPFLHVIGPLLRGTLWETIAVPELRGQALHVAEILLDELSLRHEQTWMEAQEPAVTEYEYWI
jgi:uncharacterized NAD(P)/FAD-binding protein YdhS